MIRAWRLRRVLDIDIDACSRCGGPVRAFADTALFLSSTTTSHETSSCLLLALNSECEHGLKFVEEITLSRPKLPTIVLCGSTDESLRKQYISLGAIDIVSKSMVDAYIFTRLSAIHH
jgi:FixJ family two-component response regulator